MANKTLTLFYLLPLIFYTYGELTLFDFNSDDLSKWKEESDTVRTAGQSKAALVIQTTAETKQAILFSLLNPQPNGAGFAGVKIDVDWNLGNYHNICLNIRGQGENFGYKVVVRNSNTTYTFEQFFQAPRNKFDTIFLPFAKFKPYYRGKHVDTNKTLDETAITSFGLQMYGGRYMPYKQRGVSSLEINWIKAYP